MKNEIRYMVMILGLGLSLAAYAHLNFASISLVERIFDRIEKLDGRIYDIQVRFNPSAKK